MTDDKTITVAELIELLKPFSGDTPVHVYYDSKMGMEGVTGIAEVKNDGIYLDTTGNDPPDQVTHLFNPSTGENEPINP